MAKLHGPFDFTGPLKGLSAYTRHDMPGTVILRTPYGPSSEVYHTKPSFDITRRNGTEFGGRSTTARWIRRTLYPLRPLEDYNVAAALNSLLEPLQEGDTESEFGQRRVCLSRAPGLLEGFNLNQKAPFEGVVRNPLGCQLDRASLRARVEVPALLPGVTFFPPAHQPYFRVVALLGVVPDLFWARPRYRPQGDYDPLHAEVVPTEWQPVREGAAATTLELQLPYTPPNEAFSLLLAVAVEVGTAGKGGRIEAKPKVGSAKVAAMG